MSDDTVENELQAGLRDRRDRLAVEQQAAVEAASAAELRAARLTAEMRQIEALLAFWDGGDPATPIPTPAPRREPGPLDGAWRPEAQRILEQTGHPLHYRDLYRLLAGRGFTFGGNSPEAVLLAGLSRAKNTFVAVGKGCYWLTDRELPSAGDWGPTRRPRRPRPIGHAAGASS